MIIAHLVMAVLFAAGAVVQLNDPDPIPWMAIYAAACAVTVARLLRGTIPVPAPLAVGIVALVWGGVVAATGPDSGAYWRMFDAWEMDSAATEEAREATGLFLIAGWMAALSWGAWRRRGAAHREASRSTVS
jgi:hypothetical protein